MSKDNGAGNAGKQHLGLMSQPNPNEPSVPDDPKTDLRPRGPVGKADFIAGQATSGAGKNVALAPSQSGSSEPSTPPIKPDDHQEMVGMSSVSEERFTARQAAASPEGTPDTVKRVVQGVVAGLVISSVIVIGLAKARSGG